jgi:hypothetical protein
VADRLGIEDVAAVRSLLGAWWGWTGEVVARGQVVDSAAFLRAREAEGLLELPRAQAERAIELELAYLHGVGSGRRGEPGAPRAAVPGRRPRGGAAPSSRLVGAVAFGSLAVLVVLGTLLGRAVPHVPLPFGSPAADTAPYRAWIGVLAGAGGLLACLLATRRRPELATALRVPGVGLAALALFGLGLLAGASWLEWSAGVLFAVSGAVAWLRSR